MNEEKQWKRIVALMCLCQFGGGIAIIGLFSFLPLFLSELGVTDSGEAAFWAGLISGVTPLMVAITSPFWAIEADRRGAKHVMMLILALVTAITLLCAMTTAPWQVFVLRILQGLVGGFMAIGLSVVTLVAPEKDMAKALGYFQAFMVMGIMVGPLVGGIVADVFSYRAPFLFFALSSFLCLLALHFYMPAVKGKKEEKRKSSYREEIRYFAKMPVIRIMAGMQFLCSFGITGIAPILPLYIKDAMDVDVSVLATVVGIIIFAAGGVSALSSLLVGKATALWPMHHILMGSTFLAGVTFLLQYLMPDVWSLGFFRAMTGIGLGLIMPIANTYVAQNVPEEKRNAAFGAVSSASMMGNVIGPICTGFFAMLWGYGFVFWVTAAIFLIIAILLALHFRTYKPE